MCMAYKLCAIMVHIQDFHTFQSIQSFLKYFEIYIKSA